MAKQKTLPGTEDEKHKDIIDAAEAYEELRDKRMELLKEEIDMKKGTVYNFIVP